jgi:hypothetical protein
MFNSVTTKDDIWGISGAKIFTFFNLNMFTVSRVKDYEKKLYKEFFYISTKMMIIERDVYTFLNVVGYIGGLYSSMKGLSNIFFIKFGIQSQAL